MVTICSPTVKVYSFETRLRVRTGVNTAKNSAAGMDHRRVFPNFTAVCGSGQVWYYVVLTFFNDRFPRPIFIVR